MLIIEIALGIVLGVLILAFLPYILAGGLIIAGVSAAATLLIVLWALSEPYRPQIEIAFGTLLLAYLAFLAIRKIVMFFSPQVDPLMDAGNRKIDETPYRSFWLHGYLALIVLFPLLIAVSEAKPNPNRHANVPAILILVLIWVCLHGAIQLIVDRAERRRVWRNERRRVLDQAAAIVPEYEIDETHNW